MTLTDRLTPTPDPDDLVMAFADWAFEERGLSLYPAQEEALLELVTGSNVILSTPTGSGKSLVAVAAHAAAVVRAEDLAEGEELLADQRLDRRGVEGGALVGQRGEVGAGGDEALARAGRGVEDDVGPGGDLDERLLLMRVQRQALLAHPGLEGVEDGVGFGGARKAFGERHDGPTLLTALTDSTVAGRASRPATEGTLLWSGTTR